MIWFNRANDAKGEWRMVSSELRMPCAQRTTHYSLFTIHQVAAALAVIAIAATPAHAQSFSTSPFRFTQQDGETLYRSICAGCHMPDGQGARGAGAYPPLARNEKLAAAGYPVTLVVKGQKAMPGFATQLNDDQVAAVVNYVRSSFGNAYQDRVSADDVKAARQ